jgi:hypothetical protein
MGLPDIEMIPEFEETISTFCGFLENHGLPRKIIWVAPEHTIFLGREWKIFKGEGIKESDIRAKYQAARGYPFGVRFGVLCTDDVTSYCYLYIPTDEIDAEYKLLANGYVKLSVPYDVSHATPINKGIGALWYQLRELRGKKWKDGFFGIG